MAVTRINNNQISDAVNGNVYLGVNAAAKLQNYSITSQKISNNLTYGSDLTVAGNLVVQGNVTAIDTIDLVVEDPIILLAKDQTGTPSLDIGYIGVRGDEDNIAFVWNEANAEFATVFTSSEITNTTVAINSYASLRVNDITAANAEITGDLTFDGNIIGNISLAGNLTAENIAANANVTAADAEITGNITANNISVTNELAAETIDVASIDASGNIVAGNLNSNAAVTGVDFTATETVSANNIVVTNNLDVATIDASGNVDVANLNSNAAVTGVDFTATETVSANNITVTNNIDTATIDASGNVDVANLNSNAAVTGVDFTATETVSANNVVVTNNLDVATIDASGNVDVANLNANSNVNTITLDASGNITGANLNSNSNVTGVTFTASGNINANNAVITNDVSSTTVTASGNIDGANINASSNIVAVGNIDGANINATTNLTATTVTASGNINANNAVITNDISSTTVNASGNIDGANINATTNLTATTVTASGNINANNAVITNDISTATLTASGNVDADNVNANSVTTTGNVDVGTAVNANLISGTSVQIDSTGDIVINPTGNIDVSGVRITNMSDPQLAFDAATKQYVDDAVSTGIHIHPPVQVETPNALPSATYVQGGNTFTVTDTIAGNTVVFSTAANLQVNDQLWFANSFNGVLGNIPYFVVSAPNTSAAVLSTAYNGTPVSNITSGSSLTESVRVNSGIGATLTAAANGVLVVDGVTLVNGDRVLVYQQSQGFENGVYDVTDAGNVSAPWILTRSSDADTYEPQTSTGLDNGSYFYVQDGDTGAGESYVKTAPAGPFIIGLANITFTQFSASQVYSANTQAGLVLNGTVFSAKVDNDTTAFDGSGNIIVKAGANLVTPNIGAATGTSLSLTGNVEAGNLVSNAAVIATGNVEANNAVITNNIDTATLVASGNVDANNLNATTSVTATTLIASGNVNANNAVITNNVDVTETVSANNAVITNNIDVATIDASGNIVAGNLNSNAAVTGVDFTATETVSANNAVITNNLDVDTIDVSSVDVTGNIVAGNLNSNAAVTGVDFTATETVSANNIVVTNNLDVTTIDASGNIVAGNLNSNAAVTGVDFTATETVSANNAVITNNLDVDTIDASGNVDVANLNANTNVTTTTLIASGNITGGNITTAGIVDADTVTVSGNLDANNITVTNDIDSNNITVTGTVTTPNVTSNTGLSITTGSNGNIVLDPNGVGVIILEDETANRMLYTGANKEIATDANATFDGANLVITGSLTVDNVTINGADITSNTAELTVNSAGADVNFRVAGDTVANLLVTDAGTDTVLINTGAAIANATLQIGGTRSILIPVGTTGERPNPPTTGMVRFNTSINSLEFYDQEAWTTAGSEFTIITADEFQGDGACTTFTLSQESTTAGAIVSINGIVQIPVTSYSIANDQLTFTEAPAVSDVIDVRLLTTTSEVAAISNASGNAVVEVTDTSDDVRITGDLIPSANLVYSLGSSTAKWNDLYLAGNSIYLGDIILKENAGNLRVRNFDDTADAVVEATFVATSVSSGNLQLGFNHIESLNVDGEIELIPNGVGQVQLTSDSIRVGKTNANVVVNTFGTGNLNVNTQGGNINFAVGATSIVGITTAGIVNRQANGVGNIGSATNAFNTVFARATSAQYADLAEMYTADADVAPATVVCFGGSQEVTVCDTDMCTRVAGVVSTNPSYLMNSTLEGEHVVAVALTGRVPCRVQGTVRKGDMMVAAGNGRARAESAPAIGSVIGKALENFDGTEGVIEVVVGRL